MMTKPYLSHCYLLLRNCLVFFTLLLSFLLPSSLFAFEPDTLFSLQGESALFHVGATFEIHGGETLSFGVGREVITNSSTEDISLKGITNQPLFLRFSFGGLFFKAGLLESSQTIRRKVEGEPGRTFFLQGARTSVGYILQWGVILIGVGVQQDALEEKTAEFNDNSTETVGGSSTDYYGSIGVAF